MQHASNTCMKHVYLSDLGRLSWFRHLSWHEGDAAGELHFGAAGTAGKQAGVFLAISRQRQLHGCSVYSRASSTAFGRCNLQIAFALAPGIISSSSSGQEIAGKKHMASILLGPSIRMALPAGWSYQ